METLKTLFRQWAGEPCVEALAIGAGGSSRRYFRLLAASGRSAIGAIASDRRENEAFFAFTRHLHAKGIRVPQLYAVADDRCHYLQQDLGDQTLYGLLYEKKRQGGGFDSQMLNLYRSALADLADIQQAGADIDFSVAYPTPAFDRRSILWDLNYFKYYYLKLADIPFDEQLLEDDFSRLADLLLQADCNYFMYRD
ncbi:MAG: phosphotransferase, partial [Bacteroidales bacterium]|nr:phosphotransferase [Bacteroidales bacterium]